MSEDIRNIINHAMDENPAELSDVVSDILNSKTRELINNKRIEIAQNYFTGQDSNTNDNETD